MKGHSFLEIFFIHLCHRFIRCWGKKRNLKFSVSKQKWGEPTTPWRVYLSLKMLKIKGAVGKERVLVKPRKHLKTWVRGGERQSGWLSSVLEAKPQEPQAHICPIFTWPNILQPCILWKCIKNLLISHLFHCGS